MPSIVSPRQAVWATSTTGVFFPLTDAYDSKSFQPILLASWFDAATAELEVIVTVSFSNDGVNWPAALRRDVGVYFEPSSIAGQDNWEYPPSYTAISSVNQTNIGRYVRFGVSVRRKAGSGLAFARMRLKVEAREG